MASKFMISPPGQALPEQSESEIIFSLQVNQNATLAKNYRSHLQIAPVKLRMNDY